MSLQRGKNNINMTEGPLFGNIIRYTIPIILTGILQLLFNAADLMVIGNFRGSDSVAAVGSTGSITMLLTSLLIGMATGVGVIAAQTMGATDNDGASKVVHTAIPVAVICGVTIGLIGIIFAEPLLTMMDTPAIILPKSTLYMRICFSGTVFSLTYNFSAAILRASGDTKGPLVYLTIGGVTNVGLNVIFVTLLNMDVEGVAIATVTSQAISCVLVINRLIRVNEEWKLILKKIKIDFKMLGKIIRIGLPAGIQGSVFALSNVIIQSSVNSFGASAVAGNAAAANIDGFTYVVMNSFYQATLNFTGQNVGAGKINRLGKIMRANMVVCVLAAMVMSGAIFLFSRELLGIYITDDALAVEFGIIRLIWLGIPYFLCGIGEVLVGSIRGMGASVTPMVTSILCICGIRLVWIFTIFAMPQYHSMESLYLSYSVSWIACAIGHFISFKVLKNRLQRRLKQ